MSPKLSSPPTSGDHLSSISAAFVGARRAGLSLDAFPGPLPQSLQDAYAVQRLSIDAWAQIPGESPAGWKIGGVAPHLQTIFKTERLVGPAFASGIKSAIADTAIDMPIFPGGFAAAEAEFMFRIGKDIAPGAVKTQSDLYDYIAAMHVGIEIASSPLATINEIGPLCVVSDFGNNNGLAVGQEIDNWASLDPSELIVETSIDGKAVGQAAANVLPGGPLGALFFLIEHCAAHAIVLSQGTMVTTGAVTGIHDIAVGQTACADFGQWGQVRIKAVTAHAVSSA